MVIKRHRLNLLLFKAFLIPVREVEFLMPPNGFGALCKLVPLTFSLHVGQCNKTHPKKKVSFLNQWLLEYHEK